MRKSNERGAGGAGLRASVSPAQFSGAPEAEC